MFSVKENCVVFLEVGWRKLQSADQVLKKVNKKLKDNFSRCIMPELDLNPDNMKRQTTIKELPFSISFAQSRCYEGIYVEFYYSIMGL